MYTAPKALTQKSGTCILANYWTHYLESPLDVELLALSCSLGNKVQHVTLSFVYIENMTNIGMHKS